MNPIDNMIPKGTFKPILRLELPATLGSDLAGVVVEVGSRVTRFKPGELVSFLESIGARFGPHVNASTSYPIAALTKAPNAAGAKAFVDFTRSRGRL